MKKNLRQATTSLKPLTYEEAVIEAGNGMRQRGYEKVYILEVIKVAKPTPPPVELTAYKEGL